MARQEFERLRDLTRTIAVRHPRSSARAAAQAVGERVDRLLDDRRFLNSIPDEALLRRHVEKVHSDIDRARHGDPGRFERYLEEVDGWAASLAGDPTTDPPDAGL